MTVMKNKHKRIKTLDRTYRDKVQLYLANNNNAQANNMDDAKQNLKIKIDNNLVFGDRKIKILDLNTNMGSSFDNV